MQEVEKPVIGFTTGDLNGIGIELILKTLADPRMMEFCTPVVFANNKVLNFYRKTVEESPAMFSQIKDGGKLNLKQPNIYNCWEDDINIQPGQLTDESGKYATISLKEATAALRSGDIDGLVTAPIHKKNVHSDSFPYTGHTPFLKNYFELKDVLMFMVAENIKVGLVTEHVPIKDLAQHITKENILSKLRIMNDSLKKDFGITKPKIAVLGLNPHAGDEGLLGTEEENIIKPAISEAFRQGILCFGPYSSDAFFAHGGHEKVDAVLAMYHDQGLIPFKSLAIGEGVNYTAGLGAVRTSPDHGTAFDIAGKGIAEEASFRAAVFQCIDILNMRREIQDQRKNPLRRMSDKVLRNAVDEKIIED